MPNTALEGLRGAREGSPRSDKIVLLSPRGKCPSLDGALPSVGGFQRRLCGEGEHQDWNKNGEGQPSD